MWSGRPLNVVNLRPSVLSRKYASQSATLSMIDCAVATQTNGVAEVLQASMNVDLGPSSARRRNEPRLMLAEQAEPPLHLVLNQDADVSADGSCGRAASHRLTLALCEATRCPTCRSGAGTTGLLVAVPLRHSPLRCPGRRTASNVVVGVAFGVAEAHRQRRLGAVERLNLRLFVHARTIAWSGGLRYNPTMSRTFSHERVAPTFEGLRQMRLTPKRASQLHRVEALESCPRGSCSSAWRRRAVVLHRRPQVRGRRTSCKCRPPGSVGATCRPCAGRGDGYVGQAFGAVMRARTTRA